MCCCGPWCGPPWRRNFRQPCAPRPETAPIEKRFIQAAELLADSFRLAALIYDSGYRPDVLVGIWRGGTPVAIAVHEYLVRRGVPCEHAPVKISAYAGIDRGLGETRVTGLEPLLALLTRGTRLLVVDDVLDTGRSIRAFLDRLQATALDGPAEIRVACPWYKPERNRSGLVPDYYLHQTDAWLVFPHELVDLDPAELKRKSELEPVLGALGDFE